MKQLLILFAAILLLNLNSKACHIDTLGWCNGEAHFKTGLFNNHSVFEIRYYGITDVLFTYHTKASGNTDSEIVFPQPLQNVPIKIQFRFRDDSSVNAPFTTWGGDYNIGGAFVQSAIHQLPNCSTLLLATNFSEFKAQRNGNEALIFFRNEDESNTIRYEVKMSSDLRNWSTVKTLTPNGQHSYSTSIELTMVGFILPFLLFNRKRKLLSFLIILSVLFYACKKESISGSNNYKYVRIDAVTNTGVESSSIIKF